MRKFDVVLRGTVVGGLWVEVPSSSSFRVIGSIVPGSHSSRSWPIITAYIRFAGPYMLIMLNISLHQTQGVGLTLRIAIFNFTRMKSGKL